MNSFLKKISSFVKNEWFLLTMLGAIGLIFFLFEIL
jgi:hypothetical protein